jgi:hypothetical protein
VQDASVSMAVPGRHGIPYLGKVTPLEGNMGARLTGPVGRPDQHFVPIIVRDTRTVEQLTIGHTVTIALDH